MQLARWDRPRSEVPDPAVSSASRGLSVLTLQGPANQRMATSLFVVSCCFWSACAKYDGAHWVKKGSPDSSLQQRAGVLSLQPDDRIYRGACNERRPFTYYYASTCNARFPAESRSATHSESLENVIPLRWFATMAKQSRENDDQLYTMLRSASMRSRPSLQIAECPDQPANLACRLRLQ